MITIIKDYNEYATALCDRHINRLYEKNTKACIKQIAKEKNFQYKEKKVSRCKTKRQYERYWEDVKRFSL